MALAKLKYMQEGRTTQAVEKATSKIPSLFWLGMAGGFIASSLTLFAKGKRETAIFVGLWPIALMVMGNYNKLVKLLGSGR